YIHSGTTESYSLSLHDALPIFRGDRFGLVAFAGRAYILSPLTVDHGALELYIDALDPGIVSYGGSSLSAALRQAIDLVQGQPGADRKSTRLNSSHVKISYAVFC